MKIHSDVLTGVQLYGALKDMPHIHLETARAGSRKRKGAFLVHLTCDTKDELHRYSTNSGQSGADRAVAATWDEWGIWIERLFAIDPKAIIGQYDGRGDFIQTTLTEALRVRKHHDPRTHYARTHQAPWLPFKGPRLPVKKALAS